MATHYEQGEAGVKSQTHLRTKAHCEADMTPEISTENLSSHANVKSPLLTRLDPGPSLFTISLLKNINHVKVISGTVRGNIACFFIIGVTA